MFQRLLPFTVFATLLVSAASAAGPSDSWKQLTSLAGEWEGTEGGRTTTITYTLISGGTALMEAIKMPAPEADMVTIYHRDGDSLLATHYCSVGNQPRMRAAGPSPDGKTIRFRFADITNLAKPDSGHIRHLTVTFDDPDHFTQEWTYSGPKEERAVFKWTRKTKK